MERWSKLICFMVQVILQVNYVRSNYFFAFESCAGWAENANASSNCPFNSTGTCSVTNNDSAVAAYSINNVHVQNGYLDYGAGYQGYGCPFKNETTSCPSGWSWYGWLQFVDYPCNCSTFGIVISTPVFNLHLLGNGHLALYTWLPNGTEYYAETVNPVAIKIWYPIILEFKQFTENSSYTLSLFAQGQLLAGTQVGRQRTYTPPTSNLVFGGSGFTNISNSASVKMDRSFFDNAPRDLPTYYQNIIDIGSRQYYCNARAGLLVRPLTCYFVEPSPMTWSAAYKSCQATAYSYGYPYAKLAQFPTSNSSIWTSFLPNLAYYGNGSATGYPAWLGGGGVAPVKWLDVNGVSLNASAVAPNGITFNTSAASNTSCLQVNTKTNPWEWSEASCALAQRSVCVMSYDCILENPCQNQGICLPVNDGVNVCKCWPGSSGQYCEIGVITTNYITQDNSNCGVKPPTQTFNDTVGNTTTTMNCTECESKFDHLLKKMAQYKMKLKMKLVEIDVDEDEFEFWECNTTATFTNISNSVFNHSSSVFEELDCSYVWKLFSKFLLRSKIIRWFTKMITVKNPTGFPSYLSNNWTSINQEFQNMSNLTCFKDLIMHHINDTTYQPIIHFCNHDDDDDHHGNGTQHDDGNDGGC